MFCKKCGELIEEGVKYCPNCGTLNITPESDTSDRPSDVKYKNVEEQQYQNNYDNNVEPNQDYDKIINPSMKKYAILSICIPAVILIIECIIDQWFYGWAFILLVVLGFSWAKKGRAYSKTLSNIGYVLNGIFLAIIILTYIAAIMEIFA